MLLSHLVQVSLVVYDNMPMIKLVLAKNKIAAPSIGSSSPGLIFAEVAAR